MESNFWNGKRVLVAGGAGFTGSWLCRELYAAGAEAIAFVKPSTSLDRLKRIAPNAVVAHGDVLDYESVLEAMKGVDVAFNSAAIVYRETDNGAPPRTAAVNTVGAYHVAQAAKMSGVSRLIHISTPHIYGNLPASELPMSTNTIPMPEGEFSISKYAGDLLAESLLRRGLDVIVTRGFSKYGPGQDTDFFIAKVTTHLLEGRELRLANPDSTRDYTYVSDVVHGYMLAAEKGMPGRLYHFGWDQSTTAREVYEAIVRIVREDAGIDSPSAIWNSVYRAHDIVHQRGSSKEAREDLGWAPAVSLEEGLRKTVAWYRDVSA